MSHRYPQPPGDGGSFFNDFRSQKVSKRAIPPTPERTSNKVVLVRGKKENSRLRVAAKYALAGISGRGDTVLNLSPIRGDVDESPSLISTATIKTPTLYRDPFQTIKSNIELLWEETGTPHLWRNVIRAKHFQRGSAHDYHILNLELSKTTRQHILINDIIHNYTERARTLQNLLDLSDRYRVWGLSEKKNYRRGNRTRHIDHDISHSQTLTDLTDECASTVSIIRDLTLSVVQGVGSLRRSTKGFDQPFMYRGKNVLLEVINDLALLIEGEPLKYLIDLPSFYNNPFLVPNLYVINPYGFVDKSAAKLHRHELLAFGQRGSNKRSSTYVSVSQYQQFRLATEYLRAELRRIFINFESNVKLYLRERKAIHKLRSLLLLQRVASGYQSRLDVAFIYRSSSRFSMKKKKQKKPAKKNNNKSKPTTSSLRQQRHDDYVKVLIKESSATTIQFWYRSLPLVTRETQQRRTITRLSLVVVESLVEKCFIQAGVLFNAFVEFAAIHRRLSTFLEETLRPLEESVTQSSIHREEYLPTQRVGDDYYSKPLVSPDGREFQDSQTSPHYYRQQAVAHSQTSPHNQNVERRELYQNSQTSPHHYQRQSAAHSQTSPRYRQQASHSQTSPNAQRDVTSQTSQRMLLQDSQTSPHRYQRQAVAHSQTSPRNQNVEDRRELLQDSQTSPHHYQQAVAHSQTSPIEGRDSQTSPHYYEGQEVAHSQTSPHQYQRQASHSQTSPQNQGSVAADEYRRLAMLQDSQTSPHHYQQRVAHSQTSPHHQQQASHSQTSPVTASHHQSHSQRGIASVQDSQTSPHQRQSVAHSQTSPSRRELLQDSQTSPHYYQRQVVAHSQTSPNYRQQASYSQTSPHGDQILSEYSLSSRTSPAHHQREFQSPDGITATDKRVGQHPPLWAVCTQLTPTTKYKKVRSQSPVADISLIQLVPQHTSSLSTSSLPASYLLQPQYFELNATNLLGTRHASALRIQLWFRSVMSKRIRKPSVKKIDQKCSDLLESLQTIELMNTNIVRGRYYRRLCWNRRMKNIIKRLRRMMTKGTQKVIFNYWMAIGVIALKSKSNSEIEKLEKNAIKKTLRGYYTKLRISVETIKFSQPASPSPNSKYRAASTIQKQMRAYLGRRQAFLKKTFVRWIRYYQWRKVSRRIAARTIYGTWKTKILRKKSRLEWEKACQDTAPTWYRTGDSKDVKRINRKSIDKNTLRAMERYRRKTGGEEIHNLAVQCIQNIFRNALRRSFIKRAATTAVVSLLMCSSQEVLESCSHPRYVKSLPEIDNRSVHFNDDITSHPQESYDSHDTQQFDIRTEHHQQGHQYRESHPSYQSEQHHNQQSDVTQQYEEHGESNHRHHHQQSDITTAAYETLELESSEPSPIERLTAPVRVPPAPPTPKSNSEYEETSLITSPPDTRLVEGYLRRRGEEDVHQLDYSPHKVSRGPPIDTPPHRISSSGPPVGTPPQQYVEYNRRGPPIDTPPRSGLPIDTPPHRISSSGPPVDTPPQQYVEYNRRGPPIDTPPQRGFRFNDSLNNEEGLDSDRLLFSPPEGSEEPVPQVSIPHFTDGRNPTHLIRNGYKSSPVERHLQRQQPNPPLMTFDSPSPLRTQPPSNLNESTVLQNYLSPFTR